eukprot:628077-Rhodomonas_salina.6
MSVIAEAATIVAAGSSHMAVAGNALRRARGYDIDPVYVDHVELDRGPASCAHMQACRVKEGQVRLFVARPVLAMDAPGLMIGEQGYMMHDA